MEAMLTSNGKGSWAFQCPCGGHYHFANWEIIVPSILDHLKRCSGRPEDD